MGACHAFWVDDQLVFAKVPLAVLLAVLGDGVCDSIVSHAPSAVLGVDIVHLGRC